MNKNNTSNQSVQAPNNSQCAVLRDYLVAITHNDRLAIVLNQFIYELQSLPEGGWLRITATEMLERTMITVEKQTMSAFIRELERMGFIERRANPLDPRDRTFEYRLKWEVIHKAKKAAGFNVPAEDENVPCIIKKKNLKPYRSLSSVKKNDNTTMRARESQISQDPDKKIRAAYHELIHGKKTIEPAEQREIDAFVEQETKRVSKALFNRDAKSAGERALVQSVVDGDLPLSAAKPLIKYINLQEIKHRSVLHAAVEKYRDLPKSKLRTIVHPIRYIAGIIQQEIIDFFLDHPHRQYA